MERGMVVSGVLAAVVWMGTAAQPVAQVSRGSLRGEVVDTEGTPVPGVAVTVTSATLVAPAEAKTDAKGDFRIASLAVGTYQVDAALAGKGTAQGAARILDGATTRIRLVIRMSAEPGPAIPPSGGEVITIREKAAEPVTAGTGESLSYEDLIKVPTARDPWAVLSLVPGVQSNVAAVGPGQLAQDRQISLSGQPGANNLTFLDGLVIRDRTAPGTTPVFHDFDVLSEMQVSTGSYGAAAAASGLMVNLVTRSGTNAFGGSVSFFAGTAANDDETVSANLFRQPGGFTEYGGQASGAMIANRLWFSGGVSGAQTGAEAMSGGAAFDDALDLTNVTGKLTGQLRPGSLASLFVHFANRSKQGEGLAPDKAEAATWQREDEVPTVIGAEREVIGNTMLGIKVMHRDLDTTLDPLGSITDPGAVALQNAAGIFERTFFGVETSRTQTLVDVDVAQATVIGGLAHDFLAGFSAERFTDVSRFFWPNGTFTIADIPEQPVHVRPPGTNIAVGMNEVVGYVQDTISHGNLTVALGARLARQTGENLPSSTEANALNPTAVPAASFAGNSLPGFTTIDPRVGVAYALNDQTVLRGGFGSFADPLSTDVVAVQNPFRFTATVDGSEAFRFLDTTRNGLLDPNEPRGQSIFVTLPTSDPAYVQPRSEIAPELELPKTRQFSGSLSRRIGRGNVAGHVTLRRVTGIHDRVDLVTTAAGVVRPVAEADYVPGPVVESTDAGGNPVTLNTFRLDPALRFRNGVLLKNGDSTTSALETTITFDQRLSDEAFVKGWVSFSRTSREVAGFVSDRNNLDGSQDDDGRPVAEAGDAQLTANLFMNRRWSFDVLAFQPIGPLDVSVHLYGREGNPSPAVLRLNPGDGRTRALQVGTFDGFRLDPVVLLDVRIATLLNVAGQRLTVTADLFNLLNARTALQVDRSAASPTFGAPFERLTPFTVRIGARLVF